MIVYAEYDYFHCTSTYSWPVPVGKLQLYSTDGTLLAVRLHTTGLGGGFILAFGSESTIPRPRDFMRNSFVRTGPPPKSKHDSGTPVRRRHAPFLLTQESVPFSRELYICSVYSSADAL